jgi:hypothetical protein
MAPQCISAALLYITISLGTGYGKIQFPTLHSYIHTPTHLYSSSKCIPISRYLHFNSDTKSAASL